MKKYEKCKKLIYFISLLLINIYLSTVNAAPPPALWITSTEDSRPLLAADGTLKIVSTSIKNKMVVNGLDNTITVSYPQLTGPSLASNANATRLNTAISQLAQQAITAFKQQLAEQAKVSGLPKTNSYLKIRYDLASFTSSSQSAELISIRFSTEQYLRGMAHPSHHTDTVNYDLKQGHMVRLADLFKANTSYLSLLSDYAKKKLSQNKNIPDALLQEGTTPTPEHYRNWNFTLSGLLITFDEAQVAPYYMGAQTVLIPQTVLAPQLTHHAACLWALIQCDADAGQTHLNFITLKTKGYSVNILKNTA